MIIQPQNDFCCFRSVIHIARCSSVTVEVFHCDLTCIAFISVEFAANSTRILHCLLRSGRIFSKFLPQKKFTA